MKSIGVYMREALISYHRTCDVDRYGQVRVMNFHHVFGENANMVLEYLKESQDIHKLPWERPMIEVSTYGNSNFEFKGIRIINEHIAAQCYKVLREENKNYKRAMTSW